MPAICCKQPIAANPPAHLPTCLARQVTYDPLLQLESLPCVSTSTPSNKLPFARSECALHLVCIRRLTQGGARARTAALVGRTCCCPPLQRQGAATTPSSAKATSMWVPGHDQRRGCCCCLPCLLLLWSWPHPPVNWYANRPCWRCRHWSAAFVALTTWWQVGPAFVYCATSGSCTARQQGAAACLKTVKSCLKLGYLRPPAGETIANSVYAGGERAKSAMYALKQASAEGLAALPCGVALPACAPECAVTFCQLDNASSLQARQQADCDSKDSYALLEAIKRGWDGVRGVPGPWISFKRRRRKEKSLPLLYRMPLPHFQASTREQCPLLTCLSLREPWCARQTPLASRRVRWRDRAAEWKAQTQQC